VTPDIAAVLEDAIERLRALELGDAFEPRAAEAIVVAGLHRLCVPADAGGLGASMAEAAEVLMALGAVDGSTALGFAMHVHVTGAMRDADQFADDIRARLYRAILEDGAMLNIAATEEGGGSPARGAIPGTQAEEASDGTWRLTGEKTWTTWLPSLTHVFVTARYGVDDEVGRFLVKLDGPGVSRLPGFDALGMRGSASGRLVLEGAAGDAVGRRQTGGRASFGPAEPAPQTWFGIAIAATYLGIGEGARADVVRWAKDRRPGDGSTAVASIPSVQLRLGRMDAELRAARIVVLDVARRWDVGREAGDVALAKLVATRAAVNATDEALRIAGGPGFLAGRLERAFRDARAGLINPPLEDVAYQGFAKALIERTPGS
jgi:alkylation response protein AidB-like acyl-CoA dehydrogenase